MNVRSMDSMSGSGSGNPKDELEEEVDNSLMIESSLRE